MSKPETDVIRRVFNDDGTGCYLEIGPYAAAPEFIELRTGEGESSAEYYGKVSLLFSKEMAYAVGRALIAASSEGPALITKA